MCVKQGIDKPIGDTEIVLVQYESQMVMLSFHWINMDGMGVQEIKMTTHFMKISFVDKWMCFKTQLNMG